MKFIFYCSLRDYFHGCRGCGKNNDDARRSCKLYKWHPQVSLCRWHCNRVRLQWMLSIQDDIRKLRIRTHCPRVHWTMHPWVKWRRMKCRATHNLTRLRWVWVWKRARRRSFVYIRHVKMPGTIYVHLLRATKCLVMCALSFVLPSNRSLAQSALVIVRPNIIRHVRKQNSRQYTMIALMRFAHYSLASRASRHLTRTGWENENQQSKWEPVEKARADRHWEPTRKMSTTSHWIKPPTNTSQSKFSWSVNDITIVKSGFSIPVCWTAGLPGTHVHVLDTVPTWTLSHGLCSLEHTSDAHFYIRDK